MLPRPLDVSAHAKLRQDSCVFIFFNEHCLRIDNAVHMELWEYHQRVRYSFVFFDVYSLSFFKCIHSIVTPMEQNVAKTAKIDLEDQK